MEKTILVIDDDKDLLELLEKRLTARGYAVKTLSEPAKTEEYISRFNPALLLIDVFMPGRSGFNILEDFMEKGIYKEIPKIFLTVLDDDVERLVAKRYGVLKYITKPFEIEELHSLINEILADKPGKRA